MLGDVAACCIATDSPRFDGSALDVECVYEPASGMLKMRGPIDACTAGFVLGEAEPHIGALRRIDCREITFLGAAGVTVLVHLSAGRPIPIMASAATRRTMTICGLDHVLAPEPV